MSILRKWLRKRASNYMEMEVILQKLEKEQLFICPSFKSSIGMECFFGPVFSLKYREKTGFARTPVDLLDPQEECTQGQHGQQTENVSTGPLLAVVPGLLVGVLGELLAHPQGEFAKSEERSDHDDRPDDLVDGPPSQGEDEAQQTEEGHGEVQSDDEVLLPGLPDSGVRGAYLGGGHGYSLVSEFGH